METKRRASFIAYDEEADELGLYFVRQSFDKAAAEWKDEGEPIKKMAFKFEEGEAERKAYTRPTLIDYRILNEIADQAEDGRIFLGRRKAE